MKRILSSTMITGLLLAAGLAVGAAESMAAAPAAPVLSVVNTKLADGRGQTDGGAVFAADGVNIYSAFKAPDGNAIKLVRSKDGGVTWGGAHTIYTLPVPADGSSLDKVSIAVSGDAVFPTQKIVHVVWDVGNPEGIVDAKGIYYAWADAADLNTWSNPISLNGRYDSISYLEDPSIVVTAAGNIFVKGQVLDGLFYLMTATDHEAGFTVPALIPVSADTTLPNMGCDSEIFVDKTGNLHFSYPYCTDNSCKLAGIKYTKLPAGTSTWTSPSTVLASASQPIGNNGHTGLTAYDANNIYITSILNGNLTFFSTTNGGTTWTKKVILTKSTTQQTGGSTDVTVNVSKAITAGALVDTLAADGSTTKREAKIYRSTDGGATWSSATTIPYDANFINLGVDGNGKVGVLTNTPADGDWVTYFSKEK